MLLSIQPETEFLVAVGSGSITDTTRINATNFAVANDDGSGARDYNMADVILLGVSRTTLAWEWSGRPELVQPLAA